MTRLFTIPEAAKELRCTERWLRRNRTRFLCEKRGREVLFSEEQIEAIRAATTIQPPTQALPDMGELMNLRPLPSRRSA